MSQSPTIKNRKAFHDYSIEETFLAGIVLQGTEVKSLRQGKASFTDSFAFVQGGEVWLRELYIKPFEHGSYYNHDPRRPRKLLLNKKEIRLAKGKKSFDKRESIKAKDTKREMDRSLKRGRISL